jgi:hypothetical protein
LVRAAAPDEPDRRIGEAGRGLVADQDDVVLIEIDRRRLTVKLARVATARRTIRLTGWYQLPPPAAGSSPSEAY